MRDRKQQSAGWSAEETLADILAKAKPLLRRWGRLAALAAAGTLVVLVGFCGYRSKARTEQFESWKALPPPPLIEQLSLRPDEADRALNQTIKACKDILESRWRTDATPWVLLRLASAQKAAGLPEDALETYRRLKEEHPSHYATGIAAADLTGVLEELGRFEKAARGYEALVGQEGDDSVYWQDAGRCWEMAGNRDAAVRAYEKVAEREGFEFAAARLKRLTAGKPLLEKPPKAPAPPAMLRRPPEAPRRQEPEEPTPVVPGEQPAEGGSEKSPISD